MRTLKSFTFQGLKNCILLSIIICLSVFVVHAQEQKCDLIIKNDGTKIEAIVLYVELDVIKYKIFNNQEGPTYSISKNDIATILYSNGLVDVFQQNSKNTENNFSKTNPTNSEKNYAYESIYYNAKGLRDGGAVLCALGSATIVSGLFVGLFANWIVGLCIMMPVGAVLLIPGAVMTGVGNGKMQRAEFKMLNTYNLQLNKEGRHPVNLSFTTNGLALRF